MKVVILLALVILFVSSLTEAGKGKGKTRVEQKKVKVDGGFTKAPKKKGNRVEFNTDEELTIHIEGKKDRKAKLKKTYGGPENKKLASKKNEQGAMYLDLENGVACRKDCDGSGSSCDDYCTVHDEDQSCFIMDDKALCVENEQRDIGDDVITPVKRDSVYSNKIRTRRSVAPNVETVGIARVIFHYDHEYMETFKDMADGNATAAMAIATKYTKLLANEVTIRFQTLKEYNLTFTFNNVNRELDFAIYVAHIEFPEITDNKFATTVWSSNAYDATTKKLHSSLAHFKAYIGSTYNATVPFDLHAAMTGYPLHNVMGLAILGTLCMDSYGGEHKTCIVQQWGMMADIVSHELGHLFGTNHDVDPVCTSQTYVMGGAVSPDVTVKDTYYKFSSCSATQIRDELNNEISNNSCLFGSSITDDQYLEQFCLGFRGTGITKEEICKAAYGPDSTICEGSANDYVSSCLYDGSFKCKDFSDNSCIGHYVEIPLGTKCNTNGDNICYNGQCVPGFEICPTTTP